MERPIWIDHAMEQPIWMEHGTDGAAGLTSRPRDGADELEAATRDSGSRVAFRAHGGALMQRKSWRQDSKVIRLNCAPIMVA